MSSRGGGGGGGNRSVSWVHCSIKPLGLFLLPSVKDPGPLGVERRYKNAMRSLDPENRARAIDHSHLPNLTTYIRDGDDEFT